MVAVITQYSDLLWSGQLGGGIPLGGLGAHPASCVMGAESFCWGRVDHLALRLNKRIELYLCSLCGPHDLLRGKLYFFFFLQ